MYYVLYILLLVSIEMIHEFIPSSNIEKRCYPLQLWKNVYLRWLWIVVERIKKNRLNKSKSQRRISNVHIWTYIYVYPDQVYPFTIGWYEFICIRISLASFNDEKWKSRLIDQRSVFVCKKHFQYSLRIKTYRLLN